ncbi:MAG TPA: kelch repeat-containing protein [Candidatus Dormibacteraeota bacterium]|nr:kelch repeat-containing protein [Candidatus Dormibacteraeota bacterium]
MRPATIEERVRDYIEGERVHIPVPPQMAFRILRAVEASRPSATRPHAGVLQLAAGMAFVLLLAAGIAWIRTAQSPAGVVQGTWSATGSMAVNRGSHTATLLPDGRVLVVGGMQTFRAVASAEVYDPQTRTWSSAGWLPVPSWGHTATLLPNGKVLVVGGSQADGYHVDSSSSAQLYDPRTNSWSAAASMHTPRSFHTATLMPDGRVLVVGGVEASGVLSGEVLASAELYDPGTNAWAPAPPLSIARAKHVAILLANQDVLVLGGTQGAGYSKASDALRAAELYHPTTQTWSLAASMQYARILPNGLPLPDGRVLVVGDEGSNEQTAEIFDPATGHWSSIANPSVGRADAVAVQLRSGNVLVAGGIGQTTVQAFDWRKDSWSSAGNLYSIRASATATVLPDGQVLVAGGFGNRSIPWLSAELFDPRGTSAVGVRPTRLAPAPIAGAALLLVIPALLLGLALWLRRGRVVRASRAGEIWVD